ncbi:MAG: YceI family protein [Candidatus Acidiferrales bacterium]
MRSAALRWAALLVVLTFTFSFGPALRAQETIVTLDPAQTKIEITVGSTLHTVHGMFNLKNGQIRFDPASGKASGTIVVDAASGNTDSEGRDKKMHQQVLDSQKFPEIVFSPNLVKGTIASQGTSQVDVSGIFRLHGQDHDLTLTIAVEPATGGQVQAKTKFSVPYVKWGLKNPSNFLLKVDDSVEVEIIAISRLAPDMAQH